MSVKRDACMSYMHAFEKAPLRTTTAAHTPTHTLWRGLYWSASRIARRWSVWRVASPPWLAQYTESSHSPRMRKFAVFPVVHTYLSRGVVRTCVKASSGRGRRSITPTRIFTPSVGLVQWWVNVYGVWESFTLEWYRRTMPRGILKDVSMETRGFLEFPYWIPAGSTNCHEKPLGSLDGTLATFSSISVCR